ncbi:MLP-like protein 43 [Prosopis cineraria]|uniref:MLP-like protein 43 n=1 Tax=Prosopis cineraria TaxID=364024 RepID=UPI00240FA074|nr:MLP-like protein 43 [Prosopis cineraria]
MSVASSLEADVELKTSALKFLEIFSTRIYELVTVSPDTVQSLEIVEGEWGTVGFVFLAHYTLDGKAQVVKEVVESINITELSITFKVMEGDLLEIYNSFKFVLKVTANVLSGSVLHLTLEYEKPSTDTPDPTSLLEAVIQLSKDVDAYVGNLI